MDGGAWWAAVHGVAKSRTGLNDFTFTFHFHALGEGNGNPLQYSCLENPHGQRSCLENPHGQRSLVGYSPEVCTESDTTEQLSTTQHKLTIEQKKSAT